MIENLSVYEKQNMKNFHLMSTKLFKPLANYTYVYANNF